jgi:hypothetical protein
VGRGFLVPFLPVGLVYKKAYVSGKKRNGSCLYMWRGVLVTKRLEKKHWRAVKAHASGAVFSFVGITKPTFSLQFAFSHKKQFLKTESIFCLAICGFLIGFLQDGFCLF